MFKLNNKHIDKFAKYFVYGTLGLIGILVCYALLDFNNFFINFHKLFFANNNYWQLDPATSNLIKYLPEVIFQELTVIWIISSAIIYILWVYFSKRLTSD